MKYEMVRFGEYFELRKGFSYSGLNLADESDIGFVTLNSFVPGGGYKTNSEKPLVGDIPEKFFLHDGDVCLAMTEQDKGLLASGLVVDYESNDYSSLVYSHHVAKLFPIKSGLDAKFVYNVLRIPAFRERAAYGDAGSTVQDLPYSAMYEQKIPCPPLNVQNAISGIIFDIDAKIRVNQRIASTLEQIAQTIFKSWFFDFDPVHAKARGEQPLGMDAETAALFPDSFEDSEMGPIPAGWTLCNVERLLKRHSFKSEYKSSEEYGVGSFPIVQQGEPMIAGFGDAEKLLTATHEAPLFVFGDHTCRMMLLNESFVALPNTVVFSSDVGETYWAFHATLGLQKFESYRRHWMELAAKTVVLAPISVQKVFSKTVSTLYQQSWALIHQNRTLEALRDSLLPRLISGELEIPAELLEA